MSNALRDQLLKAGLVNDKQVKKAVKEKRKETQQAPNNAVAASKQQAQQALAEKAEKDRALNQQRQEEAQKKALMAQIKQLIEQNKLAQEAGEQAYNFADGDKIKRLYLADSLREKITKGQIAVVKLEGRYDLVPAAIAEKIAQRDAGCVIVHHPATQTVEPSKTDDPYAEYQIPDDLMW